MNEKLRQYESYIEFQAESLREKIIRQTHSLITHSNKKLIFEKRTIAAHIADLSDTGMMWLILLPKVVNFNQIFPMKDL